jgi:hypothetical protein
VHLLAEVELVVLDVVELVAVADKQHVVLWSLSQNEGPERLEVDLVRYLGACRVVVHRPPRPPGSRAGVLLRSEPLGMVRINVNVLCC